MRVTRTHKWWRRPSSARGIGGSELTALELIGAARRYWYIVLAGLLMVSAATYFTRSETAYWASMSVTVVQPANPTAPKTLEDTGADAIPTAAMLMEIINGGHSIVHSSSADATLYGEGKRKAVVAQIRSTGGQWVSVVNEPVINIQAVEESPEHVKAMLRRKEAELRDTLKTLQGDLHVVPSQRMSLSAQEASIAVYEVTGSKTRAMAATFLAGIAGILTLVYWGEMLARRRFDPHQADRVGDYT